MTPLFIVLAFFLGLGGEIKYPAICKDWYLSNEEVQSVETVTNTLSKRPDCMQIGEETITEGTGLDKYSLFILAALLLRLKGNDETLFG